MKDADFYAVQCFYDGFGHDTMTLATFQTEREAIDWYENYKKTHEPFYGSHNASIVPQKFGEYHDYFS